MQETRELSVKLTRDEIVERADRLPKLHARIDELRAEKALHVGRIKESIAGIHAEIDTLLKAISTHSEPRKVTCAIEIVRGIRRVIRTDTGETIEERPATPQEMQRPLPLAAQDGGADRRRA